MSGKHLKCSWCGKEVPDLSHLHRHGEEGTPVWMCGDCMRKGWEVKPESDRGPVVWRSYSKPKRTRLVEAVECGLSEEDRETVAWIRGGIDSLFGDPDRVIDFLDRLPRMVEDRDRELADAEYEVLCAKLEADTARQILTDALERGRDHAVAALYCKLAHAEIEIRRLRGLLDGESHG